MFWKMTIIIKHGAKSYNFLQNIDKSILTKQYVQKFRNFSIQIWNSLNWRVTNLITEVELFITLHVNNTCYLCFSKYNYFTKKCVSTSEKNIGELNYLLFGVLIKKKIQFMVSIPQTFGSGYGFCETLSSCRSFTYGVNNLRYFANTIPEINETQH